ncbi:DUF4340 domain-containing protein [bacterium]|nr:DUF4340 domain-containing protein [bacterium]MBU1071735.1 DUF4340 domain-containing protein [bacterium]MBU1676961.1 DUF4340 domain-containing protein [bacterium]
MSRRETAIPRSVYPLLILLALAALWLWRAGGDGEPSGPRRLFERADETIASCVVRGGDAYVVLERDPAGPGGWRLGGDLSDLADEDGVAALLADLAATLGTEPVADATWTSLPEDYGLDGPGLFEVLVVDADGGRRSLRIGARNPATGLFYATGAGSEALFMVGEDLVRTLVALPGSVRARTLWPGFARDQADTVRLRFPGQANGDRLAWDLVARDDGNRWWLRLPTDGWARTGDAARGYHSRHADRRKSEAGADWLRLRDREIANLLSYLESDRVRDFLPPDVAAPTDGFAVRVSGAGCAAREVIFGDLETENRVQAWRDGYPGGLVLPAEIVRECAGGLPRYLHTDVLTHRLAAADSFALTRADLGRVSFVNTYDGWRVNAPATTDRERLDLMGSDLAFHLDHLAIRRVLDTTGVDPLRPPQTTLTVWATGPGVPPRAEVRFGLHAAENVPVAWFPADGRLVVVERDILITFQTVLMTAVGLKR